MTALGSSAIAEAFHRAGYVSPRDRLAEVAQDAVTLHPRDWSAAKRWFWDQISGDAALLAELFEPYRNEAAQIALARASKAARSSDDRAGHPASDDQRPNARPGASQADQSAAMLAVGNVTRLSLLDSFRINGQPIGDVTPREAMGWAGARERDARFVRLLTANLPAEEPIRKYRTPDDAAELYARAEKTDE